MRNLKIVLGILFMGSSVWGDIPVSVNISLQRSADAQEEQSIQAQRQADTLDRIADDLETRHTEDQQKLEGKMIQKFLEKDPHSLDDLKDFQ